MHTDTKIAEECKVDAVSVLTPMFISQARRKYMIITSYKAITENTSLPIFLYNNLPKTGVTITAATVAQLADIDNIVGVRDSTEDMTLTGECIGFTKDKNFSVLMGRRCNVTCSALLWGYRFDNSMCKCCSEIMRRYL